MANLKRIFIIGSPGSGKTTLAKRLSQKLNIPHFDLDNIRFPKANVKRPDQEAIPMVGKLTNKPAWIIEGVYILWIEPYIKKADLIIFLDTPFLVALYRVLWRYFKNIIRGQLRHGFKSTLVLIKNLIMYHYSKDENKYVTRHQAVKVLASHKDVIHVKNDADLNLQLFTLINS